MACALHAGSRTNKNEVKRMIALHLVFSSLSGWFARSQPDNELANQHSYFWAFVFLLAGTDYPWLAAGAATSPSASRASGNGAFRAPGSTDIYRIDLIYFIWIDLLYRRWVLSVFSGQQRTRSIGQPGSCFRKQKTTILPLAAGSHWFLVYVSPVSGHTGFQCHHGNRLHQRAMVGL